MILSLKNVAKIKEATINLSNITVIAGYNSTGKSSISKSLYGMIFPFDNFKKKIQYEKEKSIEYAISSYLSKRFVRTNYTYLIMEAINDIIEKAPIYPKSIFPDELKDAITYQLRQYEFLFSENNSKEKDSEKILSLVTNLCEIINEVLQRNNETFFTRVLSLTLLTIFNKQIVPQTLAENIQSYLSLQIDTNHSFNANFTDENVKRFEATNFSELNNNVIYIETLNIIDSLNSKRFVHRRSINSPYENNLLSLLRQEPLNETELSEEEQEERSSIQKTFQNIFEETLHGKLIRNDENFYFKETQSDKLIDIKNISSGMKCLLIIQRLIQNGSITKNTILIIDEPETNLHPEWQVIFANILVLLNKSLGIKIMINSHSPYFIRAIEIKMAENGMADKGNYYLMMPTEDNLFFPKDVTNSTEEIYQYLYKPLEDLTL